jgi:hypothetical protein
MSDQQQEEEQHHSQQQQIVDELYYLIAQKLEEERRRDQEDSELYSQLQADNRELKYREAVMRKSKRAYHRLIKEYVERKSLGVEHLNK